MVESWGGEPDLSIYQGIANTGSRVGTSGDSSGPGSADHNSVSSHSNCQGLIGAIPVYYKTDDCLNNVESYLSQWNTLGRDYVVCGVEGHTAPVTWCNQCSQMQANTECVNAGVNVNSSRSQVGDDRVGKCIQGHKVTDAISNGFSLPSARSQDGLAPIEQWSGNEYIQSDNQCHMCVNYSSADGGLVCPRNNSVGCKNVDGNDVLFEKDQFSNSEIVFSSRVHTPGQGHNMGEQQANVGVSGESIPQCIYKPIGLNTDFGFKTRNVRRTTLVDEVNAESQLNNTDFIALTVRVLESGKYNCNNVKVPLTSTFNLMAWKKYAHIFKDNRLVEFLTYGFPLGTRDYEALCRGESQNHELARNYPSQIAEFLHKGAGPGHVSPLMSRSKDDNTRRVILDLSYGGPGKSVNGTTIRSTYDDSEYELTLPNLDALLLDILSKDKPKLLKIDIAKAFRNVRIDPGDALKLTMCHEGKFYVDRSLSFGAVHGTAIFQRITDVIRRILAHENIRVYNYIDDIFACAEEDRAPYVFNRLKALIQELGLPINDSKVVAPSDVMTCMGIEVNVVDKSVRLPHQKIQEISHVCDSFVGRRICKRRELQSLLGKLLYLAKIIVPARGFLNRMLSYLRGSNQSNNIYLGKDFKRDLLWFRKILGTINPEAKYSIVNEQHFIDVYVDASLQGLGAIWRKGAYSERIPSFIVEGRGIVHFVMYNLWLALQVWGKHGKIKQCECSAITLRSPTSLTALRLKISFWPPVLGISCCC